MEKSNQGALCGNEFHKQLAALTLCFLMGLTFWLTESAAENKILVAHPQVDLEEFAKALTDSEDVISFANWYLRSSSPKESLKFDEALKEAQFAYLNGSLEHAKDQFEALSSHPWSEALRYHKSKSLSYAIFRRAQLAEDPVEQRHWMKLSWMLNSSLDPNPDYFPPPFVQFWQESRNRFSTAQLEIPNNLKVYSQLLINGKLVFLADINKIEVPVGKSTLVFLSDFYQPFALPITLPPRPSDMLKLRTHRASPFVSEICSEEKNLKSNMWDIPMLIFTSSNCIKSKNDQMALSHLNLNLNLNLKRNSTVEATKPMHFPAHIPTQTQSTTVSSSRMRWLILGAVGIATAALVVKNQSSRNAKREESAASKSHKEDF